MTLPWIIVGHGRVGQALTLLAHNLDIPVKATWTRRDGPLPDAIATALDTPCVLFLTVVDDAIAETFDALRDCLPPTSVVVHTSGSLDSSILAGRDDLHVASLHPLLAIVDPEEALRRFPDTFWTVEGDTVARDHLTEVLATAGIHPRPIDASQKILYHAAAVTAANLLVSLFDAALEMAHIAGLDPADARNALATLAASSVDNLKNSPPRSALTGPVARGDLQTIGRHRDALAAITDDPELLAIYELLTDRALRRLT